MKFNNRQFEKNIEQSMNSLDKFQNSLDNLHGGKAFDELSRAASKIDLSGIESGIDAIRDKFSALGIAGMTIAYQLTNSFINFGKRLWNISFGQIKSGGWNRALNIQQAEFMLEGLGLDVAQIRDDALAAVKGTAYGFDEAAKAAATFGTAGVKAGTEMEEALRGVAGVAAMTNRDFESIAHIFTTIASQGRVMGDQLSSLSYAGLNATAILAKHLKTTEANVKDMVSKGKVSFKDFSDAMYGAFGKHAAEANKTFTGSLSNVKAALSRIGADFAAPITDDMIPVFTSLMQVIDKIHEDMSPVIKMFGEWSKILSTVFSNLIDRAKESKTFTNIFYGMEHIFMGLITVLYAVRKAFREAFPQFSGISEAFRTLTLYLIPTEKEFNGLVNVFKILFSVLKIVTDAIKVGTNIFLSFVAVGYKALSVILGLIAGLSDIIDPYIQWIKENNVVENILYVVISAVYDLIVGSEFLRAEFEKMAIGSSPLVDIFKNLFDTLKNAASYFLSLITGLDLSNVAMIAFVVSLAFIAESIWQLVNRLIVTFGGFLYTIYNMFKQIGNVFLNLSKVFKQFAHLLQMTSYQMIAKIIFTTAASIGILALSLKLLSTINTNDIIKAGVALGALAGGLLLIALAFTKIYGGESIMKAIGTAGFAGAILAISAGIAVISLMVKLLGTMTKEELMNSVETIAAIGLLMVAMVRMTNISSSLKPGVVIAAKFLSFALAIGTIAFSLKLLAGVKENLGAATASIMALGVLMIAMANMVVFVGDVKQIRPDTFTKMATSILILSVSLRLLADIKDPNSLGNALIALGLLASGVMIMGEIQKRYSLGGITTDGFMKLAGTLVILTLCMTVLAHLALLPNGALWQGVLALFALDAVIAIMMGISKEANYGINTYGFIKFAGALMMMSTCLTTLSIIAMINPDALWNSVLALFALDAVIVLMIGASKRLEYGINAYGFLAFAGALMMMTTCLTTLSIISMINPDALWNSVLALFALDAVIILMIGASKRLEQGINSAGFLALAGSLAIMSIAVATLVKAVGDNYAGLGLSVIAIAALMAIIYRFQEMSQGLNNIHTLGFLTFASAILIISGAVAVLALIPSPGKLIIAAIAIAAIIFILADSAGIAENFSINAGTGLVIFAAAILILAGALSIIALIDTDKIVASTVAIIALEIAMSMLSKSIESVPPQFAASLAIMAAGMLILSGALFLLGQVPWPQLLVGAGVLALLILTLSVAGNIAQYAGAGLGYLSLTLIAFGASVLLAGTGIYMMAAAFNEFTLALHNLTTLSAQDIDIIIDNINRFIIGLGSVCDNIVAMAPKFAIAFGAIGLAIAAAIGAIVIAVSNYAIIGMVLFGMLLVAALPFLLDALGQIMDATGAWFEENGDKVYEFGRQLGHVFCDGILGACEGLAEAIYDKIWGKDVEEAKDHWREVGERAGNAYRENMLKAMDMYNGGEYSAEQMIEGLRTGIENGYLTEEEVMKDLADKGLEAFQDELGINSPSLEMKENGGFTVQGLIDGIKEKLPSFEEVMGDLAEGGIDSFLGKFSSADMLGGITSSLGIGVGGVSDWEARGRQSLGGQDRWQREGYSSLQDYIDTNQLKERQSFYDSIKSEIMGDLGLDPEKLMESTDAINGNTTALGDLSKASGNAAKETDKLKDSIKDSLSIFETFNDTVTKTGRDVLYSFMSELKGVTKWSEELEALSARGLNANFLQELADAGPGAYEKIHSLYSMTDQELNLFNRMYAQKLGIQRNTANQIRQTFVKNGVMMQEQADKLAKDTGKAYEDAIGEAGDKISSNEQKAIDDAQKEIEQNLIDDKFLEQWGAEISSSEAKLVLSNAFTELGLSSMDAFQQSMNFEIVLDKLIMFKNGIKDQVRNSLKLFDEVKQKSDKELKEEQISTTQMLYNMAENTKKIGRWATNLKTLAAKGMSEGLLEELRQLGPEGADKVDAFVRMTAAELKKANSLYESSTELPEYVSDKLTSTYAKAGFATALGLKKGLQDGKDDLLFEYQEVGEDAAEGFVKGIDPDAAKEAMTYLGEHSLSHLKTALDSHSPSLKMKEIGEDATLGFSDGIDEQLGIKVAIYRLGQAILDTFADTIGYERFKEIGVNCLRGLNDGFSKTVSSVKNAVVNMASTVIGSFTERLRISSPSKEFEWCAEMCSLGFANAFNSDETMENATNEKADSIIQSMAAKMQELGMINTEDIYEPVIRPVWDMSAVDTGFTSIDSYLKNKSFDISGTVNGAYASTRSGPSQDVIMITNAIKELSADNRAIRQEIANLRSDTTSLGNRIDGMSVRLDSGALVGGIVNQMDSALGSKAVKVRRRKG